MFITTPPESPSAGAVGQSCHGPVGPRDRVIAYEKAMRQLRDKYPDDFEVQTFYAFAVLAVGYATPNDTSLSKQLEAAAILEKLWKQNANHPGVVHYLIHCYDYPCARPTRTGCGPDLRLDCAMGSSRAAYAIAHLHAFGDVGRIHRCE